MSNDEIFSRFSDKATLSKSYNNLMKEYEDRFKIYQNYLESVKGSTILGQNLLKINRIKIEKLLQRITRDEITLRIMHFLENTNFTVVLTKNSKNKYFLNFEVDNFLKASFMKITNFGKTNPTTRFLKE